MFVKICGVTNEADALLSVAMGADAVGFVFAPSLRRVHADVVRDIVKRLPHETVTVGVFRDERPERVVETFSRCGLGGVQLHGGETDADVNYIRERVPFLIRALPAGDVRLAALSAGPGAPDVVLLDSSEPGSGQVFDWSLARGPGGVPLDQPGVPDGIRLMLAGGLNAENVSEAIRTVRPWGVDSASGVEASPGQKDPTRLRLFIEAAKRAGTELAAPSPAGSPAGATEPGETVPYDWAEEE